MKSRFTCHKTSLLDSSTWMCMYTARDCDKLQWHGCHWWDWKTRQTYTFHNAGLQRHADLCKFLLSLVHAKFSSGTSGPGSTLPNRKCKSITRVTRRKQRRCVACDPLEVKRGASDLSEGFELLLIGSSVLVPKQVCLTAWHGTEGEERKGWTRNNMLVVLIIVSTEKTVQYCSSAHAVLIGRREANIWLRRKKRSAGLRKARIRGKTGHG